LKIASIIANDVGSSGIAPLAEASDRCSPSLVLPMHRSLRPAIGLPLVCPRWVPRLAAIAAVLAAPACGDDGVGVVDDGPGIGPLDGNESGSTGMGTAGSTTEIADAGGSSDDPTSTCENGHRDDDETDVDCGGACPPCGPGGHCEAPEDCDTMICSGGFCQTPTCYDGMENGSEQGIDCGGSCPNSCAMEGCVTDVQCGLGEFCHDGECMPSSCENELQDTLETDVDCGGPQCPDCPAGAACDVDADCLSHVCGDDGLCALPSCTDAAENGDETDVDCGGSCPPCGNGDDCMVGSDCVEGVCTGGTCIDDSCIDMVENGSETDTDCGGPQCPDCPDGFTCNDGNDCQNHVCSGGVCVGPLCNDGVQNGTETDIDCGGFCGATCIPGQDCGGSDDCVESVCEFGQCSQPDCNDGVSNGTETDVDCGGSCGSNCVPGEDCSLGTDCTEGVCTAGMCALPSCSDGVENGDETDDDCGGACGPTCVPGEGCSNGGDCTEGVCILGVCQASSCDDGVQNGVEAGIDCAGPCAQPCPVGSEVIVNTTLPDFQVQPAVTAAPNGSYFVVAWASFPVASPAQDGSGSGVYMRVYNSLGAPVTGELLVNVTTNGNQQFPAVDAINNSFVVTWQGPDGDGNGVFARRFSSAGVAIGGEIAVPDAVAQEQRRPDVAMEADGDFVICWEDQPVTFDILCRRFNGGGGAVAGEQIVHTVTNDNQNLPVVEVADNGEWTVAWQSNSQDGNGVGVFTRRFTAAGAAIGASETQVNQFTNLNQQGPAIGMNASGEYVVTWSSDNQDGSSTGVYARRYSPAGAALGNEFLVNITTAGAQNNPVVALNADGDFVVAWQTADDGVLTGVFARRYDQDGNPYGTEFIVNPTTFGLQEEPDVAIRGTDQIIGVWSDGDVGFTNRDVRMQRYVGAFP
jgi:hypothetical protein